MSLLQFWFRFEKGALSLRYGIASGCGVTAHDEKDCRRLLEQKVFKGHEWPPVMEIIADVDLLTLDPKHVLPNFDIRDVKKRGIWFPAGYTDFWLDREESHDEATLKCVQQDYLRYLGLDRFPGTIEKIVEAVKEKWIDECQ